MPLSLSLELQLAQLQQSVNSGLETWAVHYACESFYDATDHPPAISVITFSSVPPGTEHTFSVIDTPGAEGELDVLQRYYEFLRSHSDAHIVHWNMNKSEYGFDALDNRYRFVTGDEPPYRPPQDRLFDLDGLVAARAGSDEYVSHPRLTTLAALNRITTRYSLSGEEQALRFHSEDHSALRFCIAERARVVATIAELLVGGELQTELFGRAVHFAGATLDSVSLVVAIGQRLVSVHRELARRHGGRETISLEDEYDYQDLFRGLLRLFFGDVRPEEWTPSYAGANSRIDFILPEVGVAVELKVARDSMTAKTLGEQLIVDIARYETHGSVSHLVCLVFNGGGFIVNPRGVELDLSSASGGLATSVRIFD